MTEPAIRASHLTKLYPLYDQKIDRLKESLHPFRKKYHHEFYALRDVSFEVQKGESVGIVGRNGSGKSTLLKILSGVLTPTSGSRRVHGRIASLLELGTGFSPELTGLENIYFNATLLGLSKKEIDAKFDKIIAFADIGEFIGQPVKTYSSGMVVRLGFSVAVNVDPEVLILDEALAVGDMHFQAKCVTALTRIQKNGVTILFVSHDVGAVKSLCSRAIYLERGAVREIGKASDVAERYIRSIREETNAGYAAAEPEGGPARTVERRGAVLKRSEEFDKRVAAFRYGSGEARVTYAELLSMEDEPITSVEFNQQVKIRIYVEASASQKVSVNFNILDDKKMNLAGCGFPQVRQELLCTEAGGLYLVEYILRLPLQEGCYALQTQISSPVVLGETAKFVDVVEDAVVFRLERWKTARVWSKFHLFPMIRLERLP